MAPPNDDFEAHPHAQAASLAYTQSLCSFLSRTFNNNDAHDGSSIIKRFSEAIIEASCRINPEHDPDNTVFCPCDESNERPGIRNFSAGLRFKVAAHLLTAPEDELSFGPITDGAPRPNLALCRLAALQDASARLADISIQPAANLAELQDVGVLPLWLPFDSSSYGHLQRLLQDLEAMIARVTHSLGGEQAWIQQYMCARSLNPSDRQQKVLGEDSYRQRQRVLSVVATLLAADNGLTQGRRISVFRLFLAILNPQPVTPARCPLGEDFAHLMHGTTWNLALD